MKRGRKPGAPLTDKEAHAFLDLMRAAGDFAAFCDDAVHVCPATLAAALAGDPHTSVATVALIRNALANRTRTTEALHAARP